jgi:hypothetical protein
MVDSRMRWLCLLGATAAAALAMATLLPSNWIPRTGMGWRGEHFSVYFATSFIMIVALRRPYVVAVMLIAFSGILEALQGLTPDRFPDLTAALAGAAGVISAAGLALVLIRAERTLLSHLRAIRARVKNRWWERGASIPPAIGAPS